MELTEKVGAAGGWDGAAAAAVKWTLLFLDFVPPRSPTNAGLGGGFHVCMQLVRNGKVDGFDEWSRRLPLGKRLVEGMNKISGDQIDGDTVRGDVAGRVAAKFAHAPATSNLLPSDSAGAQPTLFPYSKTSQFFIVTKTISRAL